MVAQVAKRGTEVEAGQVSETVTAPAPQGAAPAVPAGRYVIEGDPREDGTAFEKFVDYLRAAYYESLHRGVVTISFYEREDEAWPFTLILTQPFETNRERYAVLLNEDRAPLCVIDLEEMGWSDAALILLQVAGWSIEKIAKVEVEVGERW